MAASEEEIAGEAELMRSHSVQYRMAVVEFVGFLGPHQHVIEYPRCCVFSAWPPSYVVEGIEKSLCAVTIGGYFVCALSCERIASGVVDRPVCPHVDEICCEARAVLQSVVEMSEMREAGETRVSATRAAFSLANHICSGSFLDWPR